MIKEIYDKYFNKKIRYIMDLLRYYICLNSRNSISDEFFYYNFYVR